MSKTMLTGVGTWDIEVWDDAHVEMSGIDTNGKELPTHIAIAVYDDGVDPYEKGAKYEEITFRLVEVYRERPNG